MNTKIQEYLKKLKLDKDIEEVNLGLLDDYKDGRKIKDN